MYVNPIRESPVCVKPIRVPPVYVDTVRDSPIYVKTPIYVNPIREHPAHVNPNKGPVIFPHPIHKGGVGISLAKPIHEAAIFVRRTSPAIGNPFVRNPHPYVNPHHPYPLPNTPHGPVVCGEINKNVGTRYINSVNPLLRSITQVQNEKVDNSVVKTRSKRDVPFLTHGYKFMINMLPEFIQEPIKGTVNDFALTHPDKRLQKVYNQPRKLTLREKLQTQRERNMALLKNRLRNRIAKNKLTKRHYTNDISVDKEGRTFAYDLPDYSENRLSSRSNLADWNNEYIQSDRDGEKKRYREDRSMDPAYSSVFRNTNAITRKQKMTQLQKALFMRKLKKISGNQNRTRRSTIHERYWQKRKQSSGHQKCPNIFHTSEIVSPFYEVQEVDHNDDPWKEYFQNSHKRIPGKHRYRRDDDFLNFLEPFTFKDVATENHDIKEHFLRSVIREELGKYRVENEEPQNLLEPLSTENKLPHSPLLHIITFPMNLIRKFTDITKQAFPIVGSLPNIITGTKKYFKDFGRNFQKNVLHLTSGLIGDFENLEVTKNLFDSIRQRRSPKQNYHIESNDKKLVKLQAKDSIENQYIPNYLLAFGDQNQDASQSKIRRRRYLLKKVDEGELEEYLFEKLSGIFQNLDGPIAKGYPDKNYQCYHNNEEEAQNKLILQHLKPKIIIDNNGRPFLEINGYKRPLFPRTPLPTKPNKKRPRNLRVKKPFGNFKFHDSSEEADSEKIASLINHAKNHLENNLGSNISEMPIRTIKERISQLLFETDVLVHMDFEKYHNIYDDLITLQHMKTSIVQDWKRLIMSNAIENIGAKTALLERFKELQYYKDATFSNVVAALSEDNENIFVTKKLIKMLVRLQKLQCIINQVVANFHGHLHISNKAEIEKEIKYVEFLNSLNFAPKKSRNDMINNLSKDRDKALERNIFLLDKLKKLSMFEATNDKVEKEAGLLWEMKNIEKMQKTTIEELKQKLDDGYKVKNELKILFDLLKRYETCEADQRKLLSNLERESSEEKGESLEQVGAKKKNIVTGTKFDLEEFRSRWRERLNKRKTLLKKKLKKSKRRFDKKLRSHDDI